MYSVRVYLYLLLLVFRTVELLLSAERLNHNDTTGDIMTRCVHILEKYRISLCTRNRTRNARQKAAGPTKRMSDTRCGKNGNRVMRILMEIAFSLFGELYVHTVQCTRT